MAPSCKLELARFSAYLRIQDGAECGNRLCLCSKTYSGIINNGGLFRGCLLLEAFFLEKPFKGSFFSRRSFLLSAFLREAFFILTVSCISYPEIRFDL